MLNEGGDWTDWYKRVPEIVGDQAVKYLEVARDTPNAPQVLGGPPDPNVPWYEQEIFGRSYTNPLIGPKDAEGFEAIRNPQGFMNQVLGGQWIPGVEEAMYGIPGKYAETIEDAAPPQVPAQSGPVGEYPYLTDPVAEGREFTPSNLTADSFIAKKWDEWNAEIQEALKRDDAALNDSFSDVISKLRRDLADLRGGRTNINQAYNSYLSAADTIMRQAVIDAPGLDETGVVQKVGRSYDHAEGALNDALLAIDTSGDTEMAAAMNAELRFWESSLTRALTSELDMQDLVHDSASEYAKAVAQAAWSNDLYQAEKGRTEIQLQLSAAIRAKQQAVNDQNAAWERAKQRSREQAEAEFNEPAYGQLLQEALLEYAMGAGLDELEAADAVQSYLNQSAAARSGDNAQGWIVQSNMDWHAFDQEAINIMTMQSTMLPGDAKAIPTIEGVAAAGGSTVYSLYQVILEDLSLRAAQGDAAAIRDQAAILSLVRNTDFRSSDMFVRGTLQRITGASLPPFDFSDEGPSIEEQFFQVRARMWEFEEQFAKDYPTAIQQVR